jgi:hypothetical protein
MPSPFISVSRRRKRSAAPSRLTLIGAVAVVALLGMVVPALGGPRALEAASPISIAKKANKKSNTALLRATRGPKNESITSAKIANGAIGTADLGDGSVGNAKLGDGSARTASSRTTGWAPGSSSITPCRADLNGADIHGTIHGDAGAVAAHSYTTAASPAFSNVGIRILTFHWR